MTTLKERQYQLRETMIIEAMYELLVKKGFTATSMDDVATRVGISKATLYLHFKSKTELALRIIVQQINDVASSIESLEPTLPVMERVRRTLYAGIQRRVKMGAAKIDILPEEIFSDPKYQTAQRHMAELGSTLILEAQRAGEIRSDLPAPLIQRFIANMFNMDVEGLIDGNNSLEQLSDQIYDLIVRAIRP